MAGPLTGGEKARASRLRKLQQGGTIGAPDALWLADYDERASKSKHFGASRSGRRVKLDITEAAESVGTGSSAAAEAAGAALAAREEGRRLDSLTVNAVGALREAVATYRAVCLSMRNRLEVLEATHVAMLESVRDHFIARTEAEGEMTRQQQAEQMGDPATSMLLAMIAQRMGIALPGQPAPPTPRRNGAAPRRPPG